MLAQFRQMQGKIFALLLVCMGLLLFVYKVGDRDLWAPDEDEYAQIPREMMRSGDWLYPTCNNEPWTIKPALYNWLVGVIALPSGDVNEFHARIFSALGALGTFLLTFYLGKRLFSPRAGLLGALAMGTSVLFIEHGRWAQTYMPSALTTTLAIFSFYRGYTDPTKRVASYLWMYVAVGLGVLIMGPVNLIVPGLVVFFYLVVMKDLKHIPRMLPIWGILITAAIVLPWYVVAGMREDYGSELLMKTNFTRFLNTWTHQKPFWYYLENLTWAFLPWFFFLPGALHLALSKRSKADRPALKFVMVWVIALLLFFSIAQCKRNQYLLGVYPALGLLIGYLGDMAMRAWPDRYFRRLVIVPALLFAAVLAVVTIALPVASAVVDRSFLGLSLGMSAITGTFAVLLVLAWRRDRPGWLLGLPAAFMALFVLYGVHALIPRMESLKSPRPFCEEIAKHCDNGADWAMFRFYRAAYVYYTDSYAEVIWGEPELKQFMSRTNLALVVLGEHYQDEIEDPWLKSLPVVSRATVGHRELVLLANRELP